MLQNRSYTAWLLILTGVLAGLIWATGSVKRDVRLLSTAQAQATPPIGWSAWTKQSNSSGVSDFTTTATTVTYKLSNQPNVSLAVYSSTGVTAYTIVLETAPLEVSGANWAQVATIDFTDDGSVASPKWQQLNVPGRYGLIRARITAITPGAGSVQLYLCA